MMNDSEVKGNDKFDEDPFNTDGRSDGLTMVVLGARIVAALTLVCYGWWFLVKIVTNFSYLVKMEATALERLGGIFNGDGLIPEIWPTWPIIVCILCVYYLIVCSHRWLLILHRRWHWVTVIRGCIIRRFLVIVEYISWILVTICTVIIVVINILVLVPRLF